MVALDADDFRRIMNQEHRAQPPAVSVGQNLPDAQDAADTQGNGRIGIQPHRGSDKFRNLKNHPQAHSRRRPDQANVRGGAGQRPGKERVQREKPLFEPRSKDELGQHRKAGKIRGRLRRQTRRHGRDRQHALRRPAANARRRRRSAIFLGFSTSDIRRLVEVLVLAVVGILIILLVVRPLIAKIFETSPPAGGRTPAVADRRRRPAAADPSIGWAGQAARRRPAQLRGPNTASAAVGARHGALVRRQAAGTRLLARRDRQVDGRVQASSLKNRRHH